MARPFVPGIGLGREAPGQRRVVHQFDVAGRNMNERVPVAAAGLDQHNAGRGVLAQAVGENAAGRAGPDDDVIGLHFLLLLAIPACVSAYVAGAPPGVCGVGGRNSQRIVTTSVRSRKKVTTARVCRVDDPAPGNQPEAENERHPDQRQQRKDGKRFPDDAGRATGRRRRVGGRVGYLPASRMKGMVIASSLWIEAGGR